jgi:hypothetical protein
MLSAKKAVEIADAVGMQLSDTGDLRYVMGLIHTAAQHGRHVVVVEDGFGKKVQKRLEKEGFVVQFLDESGEELAQISWGELDDEIDEEETESDESE